MALKRRSLSTEYKLKLLSEVDKAPKMKKTALAKLLKLPTSTLVSILRKRKVIEESAKKLGGRISTRKRWLASPFVDVELVLLSWMKQCFATNKLINGCLIRDQARIIARKLGVNKFSASNGWLDRFKNRYGVMYKNRKILWCGKENNMTSSEWRNQLLPLIEEYDPKNIYNADETGIFFNLLIEGSYNDSEGYQDSDDRDDRLTVLLCANADGSDKLPPLVVGKSKKPFDYENLKTLPCKYVKNINAWLTTSIFEDYLYYIDHEMESLGRKILLFVDHCAAHAPSTNLKNVKLEFFPSSCSTEVQPLSNGVMDSFKQNYRKNFEHNSELIKNEHGSKVELVEAMQLIVMSWDEVKVDTIRSCFFKVGFPMINFDSHLTCANEALCDIKTIDPNNSIPTCGVQTIDELCDQLLSQKVDSDSDESIIPSSMVTLVEEPLKKDEESLEMEDSQNVKETNNGDFEDMEPSPPNFESALDGFKKFKQYVCSFNIDDDMQNTLLLMEIALYKLHSRETLHNELQDGNDEES